MTTTLFRIILVGGAGFILLSPFLAWWIYRSPYATQVDEALDQPVPFSHKHHVAGLGLDCRYCHGSVEHSEFAGMPATQVCMTCHSQIWPQAPMLSPIRASYESGSPMAWNRVHRLPDFVFFNHGPHIHAGVACATCHGRIDQMPLTRKAEPLTMQWCLRCHREPQNYLNAQVDVFRMPPPRRTAAERQGYVHALGLEGPGLRRLTSCTTCHR